jgi:hypothetical protein
MQTFAQISAYEKNTEIEFKHLYRMLKQFISQWSYADVTFAPIIGPIAGLFSRQILKEQIHT